MIGVNICFITRIIVLLVWVWVQQGAMKVYVDKGILAGRCFSTQLVYSTLCMVSQISLVV